MGVLAAELFKLRRLRITWILLAAVVAMEVMMIAAMSYWAQTAPEAEGLSLEEREGIAAATTFPTSIRSTLSFMATIGPLFGIILAARVGGDEYSFGTARQMVSMGLGRGRYVASKLAVVVLGSLLLLAGATAAGGAISLPATIILGRPMGLAVFTPSFVCELVKGAGIACFVLALYSVLAFLLAIVTRSAASATAIGILLFFLEGNLVSFFAGKFPFAARMAPYTLGRNVTLIASLIEPSGQAPAGAMLEAPRAFAVLAVWLGLLALCSLWAFGRQELATE